LLLISKKSKNQTSGQAKQNDIHKVLPNFSPVTLCASQQAHYYPDFCVSIIMKIKTLPKYTIEQINELSPSSVGKHAYASVCTSDYPSDELHINEK